MKDDFLRIRIDADFKEALKIKAAEENRTMSNFIINVLKEYLKNKK